MRKSWKVFLKISFVISSLCMMYFLSVSYVKLEKHRRWQNVTNPPPYCEEALQFVRTHRKAKANNTFFPLLINEPYKCKDRDGNSLRVFVLVTIKSAVASVDRRMAIRRTWGKETENSGLKRLFLLAGDNRDDHDLLREESLKYRDIIQGDFHDSFQNLTNKELMMLKWRNEYCPQARFIFKVDDDIFANMFNVYNFLLSQKPETEELLFTGSIMIKSPTIRKNTSKYYVSESVWQYDTYPPYVSGGSFIMSSTIAEKIYQVSQYIPLIPVDDAYLGICLCELGMKPIPNQHFKNFGLKISDDICEFHKAYTVHNFVGKDLILLWDKFTKSLNSCRI